MLSLNMLKRLKNYFEAFKEDVANLEKLTVDEMKVVLRQDILPLTHEMEEQLEIILEIVEQDADTTQ